MSKRRKAKNTTGLPRIEGVPYHHAWVGFNCLRCGQLNNVKIGLALIDPDYALHNCSWHCEACSFIHSGASDLPFEHWPEKHCDAESIPAGRFWQGFFRIATENPQAYWKQCNTCARIQPFSAFSKHSGWGPLERQMECRSCKGAINAVLNPKRTKQQLHESSVRRRIGDLLVAGENEMIDIKNLFQKFGSKCFKTGTKLNIKNRESYHIDHILPSKWLYPLSNSNACLLSSGANSNKKGKWPSEFYTNNELIKLARITGADLSLLSSSTPIVNTKVDVNKCVERYLQVRENSRLRKRIGELKKIISDYHLESALNKANRTLLGIK